MYMADCLGRRNQAKPLISFSSIVVMAETKHSKVVAFLLSNQKLCELIVPTRI